MGGVIFIGVLAGVLLLGTLAFAYLFSSPFQYPRYEHVFDVSGKKRPDINGCIDGFLEGHWDEIEQHKKDIKEWKGVCMARISRYRPGALRQWRARQYRDCLDDGHAFRFTMERRQIKYFRKQRTEIPYTVVTPAGMFSCSYRWLEERKNMLETKREQEEHAGQIYGGHISSFAPIPEISGTKAKSPKKKNHKPRKRRKKR